MKRILCVMSDAGGAHRAISKAIEEALHRSYTASDFTYEMVDIFAASRFCNSLIIKSYPRLARYSPKFYGKFYRLSDKAHIWDSLYRTFVMPFMREKIKDLIIQKKPDVILSVFALSSRIVVDILKEMNLLDRIPVVVIVVDPFSVHFSWAEPRATLVIAPTESAKAQLIKYGVPADRLLVRELPVNPKFYEETNLDELKREMGLSNEKFTVMIMGGGDGAGRISRIVKILRKADLKIQIIVVAGRNKLLQKKLNRLKEKSKLPIAVFGFTDRIPDLMSISDILITKAGPMTLMEAISKGLPMIIMGFIPGQEEGNVRYVESESLGYVVRKRSEIVDIVRRLIDNRSELKLMKANVQKMRKAESAKNIADIIMSDL